MSLTTICDYIRYATSRFNEAGIVFGHGFDNALDEATYLVLTSLYLPHDMPPVYAAATLLPEERERLSARIHDRVAKRIPTAYLVGEAWFAGLSFQVTPDVLIPRSPLAELIERGFAPWLSEPPARVLDLCCGSGCIGIATAVHVPECNVDLVDLSLDALQIAGTNAADHGVEDRVEFVQSDGFDALGDRRYDLILSNPPYVGRAEVEALPPEYAHEPVLGLVSGEDGLDLPVRILAQAAEHLAPRGVLILEVGDSAERLASLFPMVPFRWAEFERGGGGVAILERDELLAFGAEFDAERRRREAA
jgi:ribosomal protein L3 glutamine methyltransferase